MARSGACLLLIVASLRAADPLPLGDLPLLFVDDATIARKSGVERTFHPARTSPLPVLTADRPWEGERVYVYGSLARDPVSGRLLLWYQGNARTDGPVLAPQLRRGGKNLVLLATSEDGATWEKPALGLHAYDGSTANNIVFDAQSPAVVADRFESDPARRYKMLAYHAGGYLAAFSADGRRWTEFARSPVFTGGDTMSLAQDPRSGEFLAYFKQPAPDGPGRVVWLTRSRDFRAWSAPQLVFRTDEEDNRWARAPGQRTDVYDMSVLPHAGGFIGLPAIFRVTAQADKAVKRPAGQSGQDGPIDIQFVTSTDGETWRRTEPRLAMIPRGEAGHFDAGAILGVSSNRLDVGDETWVFYTGVNTGHGAPIPPKRIAIGRARWRRDGFASLDGSSMGGTVETISLQCATSTLVVNADATDGEVRVALLEADGREIPGRTLADGEPLRTDATRWIVRWRDGGGMPTDRPIRLRIALRQARLFSVASGLAESRPSP